MNVRTFVSICILPEPPSRQTELAPSREWVVTGLEDRKTRNPSSLLAGKSQKAIKIAAQIM